MTDWSSFLALVATSAVTAFGTWTLTRLRLPSSYRVAILGFPQSGKTTLITAVFEFLFREMSSALSIVPRGDETIRRLNDNMQQLELRTKIRPTTDQDVFAFRADVRLRSPLFPFVARRSYKLEIGDFPGEATAELTESDGDWLHDTPYFAWAMSADAFLFVVDTGRVLLDHDGRYVARQKAAFRAAWQRLQEHHLDGRLDLRTKPLIVVFTKADVLQHESDGEDLLRARIGGHTLPADEVLFYEKMLNYQKQRIESQFEDLILYLRRENRRCETVFVSSFLKSDGERLGIPQLGRFILPTPLWQRR